MVLRRDMVGSLALHLGLVLVVSLWTPLMHNVPLLDQTLPIEIISIEEFTQLVENTAKPDAAETQRQQEQAVPEVTSPAPEAVTPDAMPQLKPPPDNQKISEPAPVPKEVAPQFKVAQPAPVSRPVVKPKPLLDIGQVRALLNKTPDAPATQPQPQEIDTQSLGAKLSLNEVDAFRAQMRRCWSPPAGAREAENLVVNVRLSLTSAGMISAGPVVVNRSQLGEPFFRAAAESVLRAIRRCQPFSMPVEKYNAWRHIELTFDPRKMLGS